jgi:hypothetical protein
VRLHRHDCPNFVGFDVVVETHTRVGMKSNAIADLKSPQCHACGLPILFDKNYTRRFKGAFDGGKLFGLSVIFTRLKIGDGVSMNAGRLCQSFKGPIQSRARSSH